MIPDFWRSILGSLIRWLLQGFFAALVARGVFTEAQTEGLIAAIVGWLAMLLWSLYQKLLANQKLQAALTLPPGANEDDLWREMRRTV